VEMGLAGINLLDQQGGWWQGPSLIAGSGLFLLSIVLLLNVLFVYRLEVDHRSLRLLGNFWSHDISWAEIASISIRPNPRGIGHHVLIEVDGSRLPRRHWSRLWSAGYQIPTPMEKGPTELAAFLKRKRREYIQREQKEQAQ
jgi:hypothetical protein